MNITRISFVVLIFTLGLSVRAATPQSINFNADSSQGNVVRLTATASSGLAVTYSIVSGPGAIAKSDTAFNLTFTGSDPVVVQADQAGNATYSAAAPVQKTFQARFAVQTFIYGSTAFDQDRLADWFSRPSLKPMAVDAAGNVYMVGSSYQDHVVGGYNQDIVTTKFDKSGTLIWSQLFDGSGHADDGAYTMLVDGSGNVYACGYSANGGPDNDIIVLKYDASGNLSSTWADTGSGVGVRTYRGAGTSSNYASALALAPNGDLLVGGVSSGAATTDAVILRLDSTGAYSASWPNLGDSLNVQGVRIYDGGAYDGITQFVLDAAGNIYACGDSQVTHAVGGTNIDGAIYKFADNGTREWVYLYDRPGSGLFDSFTDIGLDSLGNVFSAGYCGSNGNYDMITVKVNSAGSPVWENRFNGDKNMDDAAFNLDVGKDGSVIVCGYGNENGTANDAFFVKYDSAGNQTLLLHIPPVKAVGAPGAAVNEGSDVVLDSRGNIYALIEDGDGLQYDYLLNKYSPEGTLLWSERYNSSATNSVDQPISIVLGPDGAVYIGGTSEQSNGMGGKSQDMVAVRIAERAPAVTSGPTAAPNPVTVGQAVTLSVVATDGATYTWTFGDGTSGSGASVQHTYSPAGTYQATVTIDSVFGTTSTANVSVTVQPVGFGQAGVAIDSDGDGFSDELETALGTNISSATSTPAGGAPAGEAQPIADSKLAIKLNFKKQNSDSIGVSGTILLKSSATVDSAFTLNVGGVIQTFTLAKGAAKTAAGAVKVSAKGTGDRTAKFSAKLMKGSFAATLTDEGLSNTTVKAKDVTIPVTLYYNSILFQTTKAQSYTAKQGSSGSTKDKK